jgi:hypothetical protein
MVPVPFPFARTVRDSNCKFVLKVAVAFWAWLIVTWQVPVPLQAPLQPPNVEPPVGVGVRVTTVLKAKLALQVPGQLIPLGEELTVPAPLPVTATVRV